MVMVLMNVQFGMVVVTIEPINLSETSVDKMIHLKHPGVHTMECSVHTWHASKLTGGPQVSEDQSGIFHCSLDSIWSSTVHAYTLFILTPIALDLYFSVPKCSTSVSRKDSSRGWSASSIFGQEEPQEDYIDYPINDAFDDNNPSDASDFEFDSSFDRGVRPGEDIDEELEAFTSTRTSTTVPQTTTTSTTTTTTRRITTTTRRKTIKLGIHGPFRPIGHHLFPGAYEISISSPCIPSSSH